MTTGKSDQCWFGGVLLIAGAVGILNLGRRCILEATVPTSKRFPWVFGDTNGGGPTGGGADRRRSQKDVKRPGLDRWICPVLG